MVSFFNSNGGMKIKAVVTGCAGFIGSSLTDALLKKGYEVIGIDCYTDYYSKALKESNVSGALGNDNFQLVKEDLLSMNEYPEADYVFHMAAQAGVRASWGRNFDVYTRNNIEATQRLLEFYKDKSIKKFIYSSSSSVYGDTTLPATEASPLRPVSPYGVTKLAGENLCYLYYKNFGLPAVSLRYFTVYGPRQRPDMAINKFINAIINDREITVYGDGEQKRDFTFVEDVVRANVMAAESDIAGESINIGGGNMISVNDLISSMERMTGRTARINRIERQKGDVVDTWADVSKARDVLKWEPRVDISHGLSQYVRWYMENIR